MSLPFNLVGFPDGTSVVSAFVDGEIYTAASTQAGFEKIVEKLRAGDASVVDDFDAANFANKAFHAVTDRVNVRNGVVYLDDAPVNEAVNALIMRYLSETPDKVKPLVRFIERLEGNPSFNSRDQFWRFVDRHDIHIDEDGFVILYKGVERESEGVYLSYARGTAFVNGEKQTGRIRTEVGDVVTMPRREISDDPGTACHAGLHCGARSYAEGFHSGNPSHALITVRVDPAHVVSVPNDEYERKVRVERYEIMDAVGSKTSSNVYWTEEDDYDDEDEDDYPF